MRDGKPEWTENEPSRARAHGYLASASAGGLLISGELVRGESARDVELRQQREAMRKARAERKAARS